MKNCRFKGLLVATLVLLVLLVAYSAILRLSMNRQVARLNDGYWEKVDSTDRAGHDRMRLVPGYVDLLKRQGLLKGMVSMAAGDSIGLFINLPDSTIQLMIKGVGVRDIVVGEIGASPFFACADAEPLYDLLSGKFQITNLWGTIPKEPLRTVQAPKDSSDVIPTVQPDTSHAEPVFFVLETDRGIRFVFHQTEGGWRDTWAGLRFSLGNRVRQAVKDVKAMLRFSLPEYVPEVRVGIAKRDAKILYRALPWRGEMLVTM